MSKAVYRAVVLAGLPRLRRRAQEATIFCFHNVVDDADGAARGDRSLHLGVSRFRDLLDRIAAVHEPVPIGELLARLGAGKPVAGLASLTFDDACEGFFAHALPELRRRRMPSATFVVSDAASSPRLFWWDVLAEAGQLDDRARIRALQECGGERDRVLHALGAPAVSLPSTFLPASWERIREALGDDVTIGVHTTGHANLASPSIDVQAQLRGAREAIERHLGVRSVVASYPYGLHDDRAVRAAQASGVSAALTMRYGRAKPGTDPFRLPRVNVPATLTPDVLECWAAGLRWRPPR